MKTLRLFVGVNMPQRNETWRHYKGGLYNIIAIGYDELGFPIVLYHSIEEATPIFSRRLHEFLQVLDVPNQDKTVKVPRFTLEEEASNGDTVS